MHQQKASRVENSYTQCVRLQAMADVLSIKGRHSRANKHDFTV